jgi:hypothetical protein
MQCTAGADYPVDISLLRGKGEASEKQKKNGKVKLCL